MLLPVGHWELHVTRKADGNNDMKDMKPALRSLSLRPSQFGVCSAPPFGEPAPGAARRRLLQGVGPEAAGDAGPVDGVHLDQGQVAPCTVGTGRRGQASTWEGQTIEVFLAVFKPWSFSGEPYCPSGIICHRQYFCILVMCFLVFLVSLPTGMSSYI